MLPSSSIPQRAEQVHVGIHPRSEGEFHVAHFDAGCIHATRERCGSYWSTRAYAPKLWCLPSVIEISLCGVFPRQLPFLLCHFQFSILPFLLPLQLHCQQQNDVDGKFKVPIAALLDAFHAGHARAKVAILLSFPMLISFVSCLGGLVAVIAFEYDQVFPYVYVHNRLCGK